MKKMLTGLLSTTLLLSLITPASQAKNIYFSDVQNGAWYYSAVSDATERSFFSGYSNGTFLPDKQISGSEFAVVLCNAFYPSHFEMENENRGKNWDEPYINTLKAFATSGSAALTMNFDEVLTRAQAASLLYDAMVAHGFTLMDGTGSSNFLNSKFASVEDCSPYVTQIANVISAGYMSGVSETTFGGQVSLTRAQAAVMIVNMDNSGLFTQDVGVRDEGVGNTGNLAETYTNGNFYIKFDFDDVADLGDYYRVDGTVYGSIYFDASYIEGLSAGDTLTAERGTFAGVPLSSPSLSHTEKFTTKVHDVELWDTMAIIYSDSHPNMGEGMMSGLAMTKRNNGTSYGLGVWSQGYFYEDTGYLIINKNTPFNGEENPFLYSNETLEPLQFHDFASYLYQLETKTRLSPKLEVTVENGVISYISPYETQ